MANDAFTAEEFETWLTPLEAMKLVVEAVGAEAATHILIERLRGGMIKSGARNATPDVSGHSSRPPVGIFSDPTQILAKPAEQPQSANFLVVW